MDLQQKEQLYSQVFEEAKAVCDGVVHPVTIMASLNCLLKQAFPYYYWVGFYPVVGDQLQVGPYQGTLGCIFIPIGKGVCGVAAQTQETQVVTDVNQFPTHIACDSASNSEIVVPIVNKKGQLLGVFDVDSTELGSFDEVDKVWLEKMMQYFFNETDRLM